MVADSVSYQSESRSSNLLLDDRALTFLRGSSFPNPKPWDSADPRDVNIRLCLGLELSRYGFSGTTGKGILPVKASEERKCPYALTR